MRSFLPLRPGSRFGPIYRSGARQRSGGIVVLQSLSTSDQPELGVVAGRSVGNAVQRNRAKRRLRAAAQSVDLQPNTAYVVVASPRVLKAPFSEVTGWLEDGVAAGEVARARTTNV